MGSQRNGTCWATFTSLWWKKLSQVTQDPTFILHFFAWGRSWGSVWSHIVTVIKERADYNLSVEQFHPLSPVGLWETLLFLAEREQARLIRTEDGKLNPCKEAMAGPLRSLSYTSFEKKQQKLAQSLSLGRSLPSGSITCSFSILYHASLPHSRIIPEVPTAGSTWMNGGLSWTLRSQTWTEDHCHYNHPKLRGLLCDPMSQFPGQEICSVRKQLMSPWHVVEFKNN